MSMKFAELARKAPKKSREEILASMRVDYDGFRNGTNKVKETEIRTKQSFKDETDINKIMKKAQVSGSLSHLLKYPAPVYGEFEGVDLLEAHRLIDRANEIFNDLPSEIKNEFGHDALKFAGFASDPANNEKLAEILPALARPGTQFPNPVKRGAAGAGAATPASGSDPAAGQGDSPSSDAAADGSAATGDPAPSGADASSGT